jgi:hypothetical protein
MFFCCLFPQCIILESVDSEKSQLQRGHDFNHGHEAFTAHSETSKSETIKDSNAE